MKEEAYEFRSELFLRTPFYPYTRFDLKKLPEILLDVHFRNAVWLASPGFYALMQVKGFDWERLDDKEKFTLVKYFNRMCYRPTPFGIFAAFSLLHWADGQPVSLPPADRSLMTLLPDRARSAASCRPAEQYEDHTLIRVNPTLYRLGAAFRYYSSSLGTGSRLTFGIDQVDAVKFNQQLLRFIGQQGRAAAGIVSWIVATVACTPDEAGDYLRFLLADQVLITPAQGYLINEVLHTDAPAKHFWEAWKNKPLKNAGNLPETVFTPGLFSYDPLPGQRKAYYYAALARPVSAGGPGPADQQALAAAFQVLRYLCQPLRSAALDQFRADFLRRFEREKVPLLLALDPDAGIAYEDGVLASAGSGLLAEVRFPKKDKAGRLLEWEPVRSLFLRLWLNDPQRSPFDPIVLTDKDLPRLDEKDQVRVPPSVSIMFRKLPGQLLIEQVSGVTATQLIARFSVFSEPVFQLGRAIAQAEAACNPEVLFADIGQLSDNHADNINRRKALYDYEIPINTFSQLPAGQQLALADLLISVRGEEIVLETASSGKRVIPRLCSAYNYHHNELALFRLLGDLQFQGLPPSMGLDLMRLYPGLHFYPRVTYGNTVLCLAKWVLDAAMTDSAVKAGPAGLAQWRAKLGLPVMISAGEGDQQLTFNLADPLQAAFFIQCLTQRKQVVLHEYLLPDRSVQQGQQPFAGQYLAFLINKRQVYFPVVPEAPKKARQQRQFVPGSNWLYVKLYCTKPSANTLLKHLVRPVLATHHRRVANWFFIRYADPRHHIRLRIKVKDNDPGGMMIALQMRLNKSGLGTLISSLQYDTYQRELERYGAAYIDQVESVFNAGSELFLIFQNEQATLSDRDEFRFGLQTARQMIRIFLPEEAEALRFCTDTAVGLMSAFDHDKTLKMDLDQKYRKLRIPIQDWLRGPGYPPGKSMKMKVAWTEFCHRLERLTAHLAGDKYFPQRRMLADLIHMQLNRTFLESQRQQELLVYTCLRKYLVSATAQLKSPA